MSIIADYDFKTSICELIDNAIDHWTFNGKQNDLSIQLFLAQDRQIVTIVDNAGGVPKKDIDLLVTPGASREGVTDELIGNFGVGGKRAGVALGSRTEVTTRHLNEPGHRFVIDDDWLAEDSWQINISEVNDSVNEGSTTVKISELRQGIDFIQIDRIKSHLSETYAEFISNRCSISVNGDPIHPTRFDEWAYPPEFSPQTLERVFTPSDDKQVRAKITGGLLYDRDPVAGNYGVYFYCNSRLIVSHIRNFEVGFHKGAAGTTHPDASLCRVIVEFNGPPELMPWTSNKSAINWSSPTFLEVRDEIITMATRFSKISRGLKNERATKIDPFQSGNIELIESVGEGTIKRIVELKVPRARKKAYSERLLEQNIQVMHEHPWTRGLVEAMSIVDVIYRKNHETRNRMGLILLDSNLEIGLKEFLVHLPDKHFSDSKIAEIFEKRRTAIDEVKNHVSINDTYWQKVRHYYDRRNKLIHERATIMVTDSELNDYREVVEKILAELFKIDFSH